MLTLPDLYHWSPRERRARIEHDGLRPRMRPTCSTNDEGWRQPMVCLAPSPRDAWDLSGGVHGERGQVWDLWQVALADGDEVHVQPWWGPRVVEVRVANRIPKRRVWRVGERTA